MAKLGVFLRDAWRLSKPYYTSEERWSARLLLGVIIAMNLALVGMDVILNFWNGAFYDALQNKNWHAFISLLMFYHRTSSGFFGIMPGFSVVAALYIAVAVYRTYLRQWLQIRWRRWMTARFVDEWLADRAYYRISLTRPTSGTGTDNPDQRISEDIRDFVTDTLVLGLDLLSNVVELVSFVGILWSLSGAMHLFGIYIPGYMVWVALLYAIVGTWLTHLVGRPLAALNFMQQRFEADFRFALVRFRENTEGVALYGGEAEEKLELSRRFTHVIHNWWGIMQRTKLLNALVSGYTQIAIIFPFVVAAPQYFFGKMQLGGLTRTASAFGQVQTAMSWFVNSYASLATWSAEIERLATFHRSIIAAHAAVNQGVGRQSVPGGPLALKDLTLALPDGKVLLEHAGLSFPRGSATVISGRTGSGKSTLFRAIAGIWPFASGKVELPSGSYLFLPQRPYIPLGTLRHAIAYPDDRTRYSQEQFEQVLTDMSLEHLIPHLDEETLWTQRLSGGEQQRLALARAILLRPDWLFLDEATANLDPESERAAYHMLRERLRDSTIVSIAHRPEIAEAHDRRLEFRRDSAAAPGRLASADPEPV
ncbi:MAG TPA: ABC transporter ATP-binding protein/permease [Acetobacteraceae bacterium]|nr:ABC transporter ATP-binding protein/permease [Acetobacteraceae bacterium]